MIQRIQSLYLFLTFLITGMLFFAPLAQFMGEGEELVLSIWKFAPKANPEGVVVSTIQMGILAVLSTALPLVTLFLYRLRWVQLRLCVVEIILLLGLQIYIGFYLFNTQSALSELAIHSTSYSITAVAPLVGAVLSWLAFRGVVRDENLIKSLDRIR